MIAVTVRRVVMVLVAVGLFVVSVGNFMVLTGLPGDSPVPLGVLGYMVGWVSADVVLRVWDWSGPG